MNTQPLTVQQRMEIYQCAIPLAKDDIPFYGIGLCRLMAQLVNEKYPERTENLNTYGICLLLTEFQKQRPYGVSVTAFWWPLYQLEPRLQALNNAIELCKQQLNS